MKIQQPVLVFDDSVKDKIVKALGYTSVNKSLVDEDGRTVSSQDFDEVSYDNFGGILIGSKIPIKNEESELVKYFLSAKD